MNSPVCYPMCLLTLIFLSFIPASANDPETRSMNSQPAFILSSPQVELAVTETGGHMAPVTFFRDSKHPIQPYYISPWQDEKPQSVPAPVLVSLRGDFFCMPFGGNAEAVQGELHPPHGEIAGAKWQYGGLVRSGNVNTLTLHITTQIRPGKVTRQLSLIDNQNVIYSRHTIEGFAGDVPLGHHATLAMPDKEGSVRLASSPILFGMTYPGVFSNPEQGEYQSLLPGTRWTSLTDVPVAWKNQPNADLSRLPARRGFADLIQLVNQPSDGTDTPAWTTATFPEEHYLWFSLKDPSVLRTTVFWIENHGRHGHPWNGRNNCLGLEDVTAHFADGLAASLKDNVLTAAGIPTTVTLSPNKPTSINYIQGVVRIPDGFEMVRTLKFAPHEVTFISTTGQQVSIPVHHDFLKSGTL
jgi:hypothetical protein